MGEQDRASPMTVPFSRWSRLLALGVALGLVLGSAACVRPETGGMDNPVAVASATGQAFLDAYVDPDGRVVRRDQGGDTVSEGQAYALLIAVALGDRERFTAVWTWTRDHLQRPDKLLSWRWTDGAVVDANSATGCVQSTSGVPSSE